MRADNSLSRLSFALRYALIAALGVLQACSLPTRREAVPPPMQAHAQIPGLPGIRYVPYLREDVEALADEAVSAFQREKNYHARLNPEAPLPPAVFLAISGGGDKGAYSAGLLTGWTASGTRPEFKLVTGVSTGALIAPFAFLGSAYDRVLREVYTRVAPHDVLRPRNISAAIFDDAMADNAPLWRLVEKHVDQPLLDAIAAEYAKGRFLFVGTTNLDARLPVLWNMTKLAASHHPKALQLFRSLLIASAAIPGAFPPVLIDVEANGRAYQEMHVDGGASAEVFLYPPSLGTRQQLQAQKTQRERSVYIIRNARIDPDWAQVERRTLSILQRAIDSLIQSQGIGDLYRIYTTAQQDGLDFNLAYIPSSFQMPHREEFDTVYMGALFETGYKLAVKGYPWKKTPPGMQAPLVQPVNKQHRVSGVTRPSQPNFITHREKNP